jgi:predicted LPLAT superfamily acyltransferase
MTRLCLRPERLEWRAVGDEIVALDVADSTYLAVGAVGAAMWPRLAEGTDEEELVALVLERFAVDEPTARRDIAAFLGELADRDLLER